MPDMTLDDISTGRWTQVARRIRAEPDLDDWAWHLSDADREVLLLSEQHGSVIITHEKGADGVWVLVARRVRQPCGAERFAVAGRNLFR